MREEIKIQVPEDIKDITLGQMVEFNSLQDRADTISTTGMYERVISLFTGMKKQDVKKLDIQDYEYLGAAIEKALKNDAKFEHRFYLHNVEYGMIPNLNNISAGEYVDLSSVGNELKDLHKVMAILFRPIVKSYSDDTYEIISYDGKLKERGDIMKHCPMNIVNGAMGFFLTLSQELEMSTLRYTEAHPQKSQQ